MRSDNFILAKGVPELKTTEKQRVKN